MGFIEMNILFLCHKIPYPPNKGDRIPTFYRMEYLAKKHNLHLVFPCYYKEEMDHLENLRKYSASIDTVYINPTLAKAKSLASLMSFKPLTLPYFYSSKLNDLVQKRILHDGIDLIYVFSSSMGQYVAEISNVKKIMDFVDADSHKWFQYSLHTVPPLSWVYYLEWKKMQRYEQKMARCFDHTISISTDEKELFRSFIKDIKMSVVPNGVNLEYFKPQNEPFEPKRIVFVGAMDYHANVDAVLYFFRKIFPIIKDKEPDVEFYIVGSRPSPSILKLRKDKNVVVTGYVDDVRKYLNKACAAVVPLRIARGLQNKILEAMSAGVPVVTTSKGNEGINAKIGQEIFVEDNPLLFANSVLTLMTDVQLRNSVAEKARVFVENNFNWESNLKYFEEILVGVYKNGSFPTLDVENESILGVPRQGNVGRRRDA